MSSQTYTIDRAYDNPRELVPEKAFKIALWVCIGACALTSVLRFCIRIVSFRRLLFEDYLMLFSLVLLITTGAILQYSIGDIYMVIEVQNEVIPPGLDFPQRMVSCLRGAGIVLVLNTIGIWAIKLNFLVFFRGFGHQIRTYMILWWLSLILVVGIGAAHIGIIPYYCVFGPLSSFVGRCSTTSGVTHLYAVYKASVAIDVISDAIIIGFPTFIVWRTRITLRQKILLTGIFLLVVFTIVVTIVRGSIFGSTKSLEKNAPVVLDMISLLFWFMIEYTTAFIIACIVSLRSLWVSKSHKTKTIKLENQIRQRIARADRIDQRRGWKCKLQRLEESLLNTCIELEGMNVECDGSKLIKLEPPSGSLAVDFSQWGDTSVTTSTDVSGNGFDSRSVSVEI